MKTKLLSEHPGLIGELLRRHEAREVRRFKQRNESWMGWLVGFVVGTIAGIFWCWMWGILNVWTLLSAPLGAAFGSLLAERRFWRFLFRS